MILFHYSVDSYHGDCKLQNDYANRYRFAEPFILALEQSFDCFQATYFSCMYFSREICDLKLRKHDNYQKDAVEALFEYVRQKEFSDDSCSRLACVYYCYSKDEAISCLKEDCLDSGDYTKEQIRLLEVEVSADRVFQYDQQFLNQALQAIASNSFDEVVCLARRYFSKEVSSSPVFEVLCDSDNRVVRELAW